MMEEAAIPVIDPLVLEEESAIVSETDGAPHSSDDEGLNLQWLSSTHIRNPPSSTAAAAAASCTPNHHDDEDENDSVDENEMKESAGPEDFYCSNMDDEDEAYVYKHLRSGREETVHVRRAYQQQQNEAQERDDSKLLNDMSTEKSSGQNTSNHLESTSNGRNGTNGEEEEEQQLPLSSTATTQMSNPQANNLLHQARLLKPRTSDAILSCPRCFNVVCMDCQQHERYSNQYRAMFVMNIGVDWTKKMMYDDAIGGLKAYTTNGSNGGRTLGGMMEGEEEDASVPDRIPHDDMIQSSSNATESEKEAYYSVHCSYCRLELAALDMGDEIYYFFGCIASS